jgi:glucose-1-phosphate thymidylyltransferase
MTSDMKALLAAGGRATRLRPITWTINKHLIPLAGKPMLQHAIEKLVAAGITEIIININPGDTEMREALGNGERFGATLHYMEQEGGPKGIAHAVRCAEQFIGNEPFVFYLGDNVILGDLAHFIRRFTAEQPDAMLALAKVPNPQRFGVPIIQNGKIVKVLEKPKEPPCDLAVTGIYFMSPKIFEAVKSIAPSARGEYDLADAFTWLLERGGEITYEEITGWWKDTGTPDDLIEGSSLLLRERARKDWTIEGEVRPGSVLRGDVAIGKGAVIGANTVIRGPVIIGDSARLDNCYIGPYTTVGSFCVVENAEIERSIIFDGCKISDVHLADSLIGKNAIICREPSAVPKGSKLIVGEHGRVEM